MFILEHFSLSKTVIIRFVCWWKENKMKRDKKKNRYIKMENKIVANFCT